MKEERGDLWTHPAQVRAITTNGTIKQNGRLVMGAGIAKQALCRHPELDLRIADLVKTFGNVPFFFPDLLIMTFPTKDHWKDDSTLELIADSAQAAARLAAGHKLTSIALPRPGCGLGGLRWENVRRAIIGILDDRFTILSI